MSQACLSVQIYHSLCSTLTPEDQVLGSCLWLPKCVHTSCYSLFKLFLFPSCLPHSVCLVDISPKIQVKGCLLHEAFPDFVPPTPWRIDLFLPWALLYLGLHVVILFVTKGEGRSLLPLHVVVLYEYYNYRCCGLIHAYGNTASHRLSGVGNKDLLTSSYP